LTPPSDFPSIIEGNLIVLENIINLILNEQDKTEELPTTSSLKRTLESDTTPVAKKAKKSKKVAQKDEGCNLKKTTKQCCC
jgi:hypothetical protein